jgi:copper resistance protein D
MAWLIESFGFLSVLMRAVTLAFQSLTVGGILFTVCILKPLSANYTPAQEVLQSFQQRIRWFALALVGSQLLSVTLNCIVLMDTADLSLSEVLGADFFVAGATIIIAALAIALFSRSPIGRNSPWLLALSFILIGASVMLSHAASRVQDRWIPGLAMALHQLATASWIGGMPFLLIALVRTGDVGSMETIAKRFSILARISVVSLGTAGLVLSMFYIDSPAAIYGTAYGVMVASKVLLFAELLLLGTLNFYLVRGVRADPARLLARLRRFAEAEIGLGFTVILAAASLTSVPPASDLTMDRLSGPEIVERMRPRWPRLRSPKVEELSEPTLQKLRRAAAQGTPVPESYVLGAVATTPNTPADIAWSEYNHHWSGLVVLSMGLLALIWRTGYAPWARHWPLLFLALAAFLFLRADPENWPLGPNGFFESFANSEVLQHRAFVVLISAFAFFEWRVRSGKVRRERAALVFPMVCSLGGALLLTHSHALENVKAALLAELTHVPLALLGVTAGWARWLEIRLSPEDSRVASWIWPVCFVVIGFLLLFYRES